MDYVYKACNPTILNLSVVKKKISLGLLDYRPKLLIYLAEIPGLICVKLYF